MHTWKPVLAGVLGGTTLIAASMGAPHATGSQSPPPVTYIDSQNGDGISRTLTTARSFDLTNPFFQPLGTNGRTCATCHPVGQGMTIGPEYVTSVFNATAGLDPLFDAVDGANSPTANLSTVQAREQNCSMLLNKALIRIGLPIPATAQFSLAAADDPYHYASAKELSCFRRPLPVTNLRFLGTVMWDGRELIDQTSIQGALESQARDAVLTHMQGTTAPSAATVEQILQFETSLYTSQIYDNAAGNLDTAQIPAGPEALVGLPFYYGINDAFGFTSDPAPFNSNVFTFYVGWLPHPPPLPGAHGPAPTQPTSAQQSVARGEQIFNTRKFLITGVAGLNDVLGKPQITGTCSSCHSTPGSGDNALPLLLNTGIADGSRRTPDMPLYTLRNNATGATVQTTDPGAALTTGKWADIGKFKVPSLRGLETQSPYMHNGFSGELLDVLDFYNARFDIGLSAQDEADLKAFLTTL